MTAPKIPRYMILPRGVLNDLAKSLGPLLKSMKTDPEAWIVVYDAVAEHAAWIGADAADGWARRNRGEGSLVWVGENQVSRGVDIGGDTGHGTPLPHRYGWRWVR